MHAGLPHARHKRSVPHSRKLKTDPQVRILFEDGDDDGGDDEDNDNGDWDDGDDKDIDDGRCCQSIWKISWVLHHFSFENTSVQCCVIQMKPPVNPFNGILQPKW